jgi:L-fuconolactonase
MTAERFLPMMDEVDVDRAIIAPPYVSGFDPVYALECAARYPDRLAVMGRYNPDDPSSFGLLEHWLDWPGMLALRLNTSDPDGAHYRAEGTLDAFWPEVERRGIPVSISCRTGVVGMDKVAAEHPGLRLIIDHLHLFGARPEEREGRLATLLALAKYPNVAVKVSALPNLTSEPYPYRDLHEPIRRVHEAFGPKRMLWGGDQSTIMADGHTTYRENIDTIRVETAKYLPAEDIEWILGKALAEWLNWPEK